MSLDVLDDAEALRSASTPAACSRSVARPARAVPRRLGQARGAASCPPTYRSIDRIVISRHGRLGHRRRPLARPPPAGVRGARLQRPRVRPAAIRRRAHAGHRLQLQRRHRGECSPRSGRRWPITVPKIVITTGGQLLTTARANGVPAFTFELQGRAARRDRLGPDAAAGHRRGAAASARASAATSRRRSP